MAFPESFLQELAERNDIVDVVGSYVRLTKKSGSNLFGLCPFHSEKTPSFSVSPDKQIYHCFGCGKGGSVISFIMEIENLSFPEAVAFLANRAGMQLPEHTFYVDFIYAYQPFPWVKSMLYMDIPFYHYFIGREGQSVQTDVMIRRVAQLRLVNQRMVEATPEPGTVPDGLYRYMIHFLAIESSVTSVFLILSKDKANYRLKDELWADIDKASPAIGRDVRRKLVSRALNLRGSVGRWVIRRGYVVAEKVVGFN